LTREAIKESIRPLEINLILICVLALLKMYKYLTGKTLTRNRKNVSGLEITFERYLTFEKKENV
jgi:hypothetical protein